MKKFLLATTALVALSLPAAAADMRMPVKAPVAYAPAFSWTGFYIGVNAGWANSESDGNNTVPGGPYFLPANAAAVNAQGTIGTSKDGFTGGAQAGYNWQAGALVYGIEADINFLDGGATSVRNVRYATAPLNGNVFTNRVEADWMATLRARLGFTAGAGLFYVTGGAAFADFSMTSRVVEDVGGVPTGLVGGSSFDGVKAGWTVGAGVEWALNNNWSVKAEYLYADFGSQTSTTVNYGAAGQLINHSADLTIQTVRAGLNYKF